MNRSLALLPSGAALAIQWQRRFAALSLPRGASWRLALTHTDRAALVQSHLELLPPDMRCESLAHVVDVGANEGQWLAAFLRFVSVKQVEVYEPIPACAQRLRTRFTQPGITIHAAAVGAEAGTATLKIAAGSDTSSLLPVTPTLVTAYQSEQKGDYLTILDRVDVPVVTLDETLPDRPVDLLKIDVQGFERQVIAGAAKTLARTRAIIIETNYQSHYEGDALFPELWQLLEGHGFRFWSVGAPHCTPDGRAWWADAVFLRPCA